MHDPDLTSTSVRDRSDDGSGVHSVPAAAGANAVVSAAVPATAPDRHPANDLIVSAIMPSEAAFISRRSAALWQVAFAGLLALTCVWSALAGQQGPEVLSLGLVLIVVVLIVVLIGAIVRVVIAVNCRRPLAERMSVPLTPLEIALDAQMIGVPIFGGTASRVWSWRELTANLAAAGATIPRTIVATELRDAMRKVELTPHLVEPEPILPSRSTSAGGWIGVVIFGLATPTSCACGAPGTTPIRGLNWLRLERVRHGRAPRRSSTRASGQAAIRRPRRECRGTIRG